MKKIAIYIAMAVSIALTACSSDDDNSSSGINVSVGNTPAPGWVSVNVGEKTDNPQWTVNSDSIDLSSSMTMTISMRNIIVGEGDSMAAFIDSTFCIGVAKAQKISGQYYFPLFVNRPLNHTSTEITLRYYNASNGTMYTFNNDVPSYVSDGIYGTYDNPLAFTPSAFGTPLGTAYVFVKLPDFINEYFSSSDEVAVFDGDDCVAVLNAGVFLMDDGTDKTLYGGINMYSATSKVQFKYYSSKLRNIYVSDSLTISLATQYDVFEEPNFKLQ